VAAGAEVADDVREGEGETGDGGRTLETEASLKRCHEWVMGERAYAR
jgi:hypothetical protein